MDEVNIFGQTNFRNKQTRFGIKTDDRRRHIYVIGKTGMGKTTLLENMIISDILAGKGVGVIDPHGELAAKIVDFIPENRVKDTIYFNPADIDYPIAFNCLEEVSFDFRHLVASGIMGVFKKVWPDVWSARMEYILNNSLLALLETPGSTLLGIMMLLSDRNYRRKVVNNLRDPVIKSFWVNEFARYSQSFETEATAAIQNKVGQFLSNPLIRNVVGQRRSSIDIREVMDKGKILIVNLSKGKIGEDNAALLGGMIITKLQLAAMSRIEIPEEKRQDFYLYVDEFQNFATESFANILSEARKYRLDLILAHQYIAQLHEKVCSAVFGNVGTIAAFRIGAEDAEFLEKEFAPEFTANDLLNLAKYNIYLKLMIDGISSKAFSAQTLAPFPLPEKNYREEIIKHTRQNYTTPRAVVEKKIAQDLLEAEEAREKVEFKKPAKSFDATQGRKPFTQAPTPRLFPPTVVLREPLSSPPSPPSPPEISLEALKPKEGMQEETLKRTPLKKKKEVNLEDLRRALEKSLSGATEKEELEEMEEEPIEETEEETKGEKNSEPETKKTENH